MTGMAPDRTLAWDWYPGVIPSNVAVAVLPQLRPASPTGSPGTLPTVAESPQVAGAKPVAGLSTILANPLRAADNPFVLDPPDQAVAAGAGTVTA